MSDRISLQDIDRRHFEGMEGERFTFRLGDDEARGELVDVSRGPKKAASATRKAFSLVFQLEKGVATESGVYSLEHEKFEPMDLLMTPLQPDEKASYFEIVFA